MLFLFYALYIVCFIDFSVQHGFLAVPPQRSSLWREEFDNPVNYNDNQLYCGGRGNIQRLGGLCGVCGDPYDGPRENEAGGKYANGIIGRRYEYGTPFFKSTVVLTAYHKGYFEFRLCPHNNPNVPVKQECLNQFLLPVAEHEDLELADVLYRPPKPGIYNLTIFLPPGIRCSQCVIQWRYRSGNSWGVDPNGTACIGCGIQEEFRNCADISIGDDESIDVHIQDFVDERFINRDERKNLPGESERPVFPPVERKGQLIIPNSGHQNEIDNFKPASAEVQSTNSILNNMNKIVSNAGEKKQGWVESAKGNDNSAVVSESNPKIIKTGIEIQHTNMDSGNSVNRNNVIGGVWSKSVEKHYSPKKENSKLKTFIFGLIRKYNQASKTKKLKNVSDVLTKQYINKIDSAPHLRKLAMQLKYLIAQFHNRHLYTRLVPSAHVKNAATVYRNYYNYIAKNSLEAQEIERTWKFSPDLNFRSSRNFAT